MGCFQALEVLKIASGQGCILYFSVPHSNLLKPPLCHFVSLFWFLLPSHCDTSTVKCWNRFYCINSLCLSDKTNRNIAFFFNSFIFHCLQKRLRFLCSVTNIQTHSREQTFLILAFALYYNTNANIWSWCIIQGNSLLFATKTPKCCHTNCTSGKPVGQFCKSFSPPFPWLSIPASCSQHLLMFDAQDLRFRSIRLRPKQAGCAVCGENPSVTRLIDYEAFCGSAATDKVGQKKEAYYLSFSLHYFALNMKLLI